MMTASDKKRVKSEMLDSAKKAIEEYARTTRGAHWCGETKVTRVGNVLEIKCGVGKDGGCDYFNLMITSPQ